MRREWERLHEKARKLGKERNAIGHTSLAWHRNAVVREVGRPWSEFEPVTPASDNRLLRDLSSLAIEIDVFTT